MAHNIHGKMVYSFEQPMWHGLTAPSLVPMSAEEILDERFGGGFDVQLRAPLLELNGEMRETGDFGIVRTASPYDPNETLFGWCSDRYTPLQPREVARAFDENVRQPAETMAFLGNGNDMFISWMLPSFQVDGDRVDPYGIVRTGFSTLKGTRLFTSAFRPVCSNTITLAEGWANKNTEGGNQGMIWKGKGVSKNLLRDLGIWLEHVQRNAEREVNVLSQFFSHLAKTPVRHEQEVKDILETAFPTLGLDIGNYPSRLKDEKIGKLEAANKATSKIKDGIFSLYDGLGTEITPNYWGVLNATTEYFCHYQPSKKPVAESVMFGGRAKNSMAVVEVLSSWAD